MPHGDFFNFPENEHQTGSVAEEGKFLTSFDFIHGVDVLELLGELVGLVDDFVAFRHYDLLLAEIVHFFCGGAPDVFGLWLLWLYFLTIYQVLTRRFIFKILKLISLLPYHLFNMLLIFSHLIVHLCYKILLKIIKFLHFLL